MEWVRIPMGEPLVDGLLGFMNIVEGAAANHAVCDEGQLQAQRRYRQHRTQGGGWSTVACANFGR